MGASLALSLQAALGFPDRHCDWQEAGYPQGNPSSRLGDPHCLLLLNSAGNQGWQPPVGGRSQFPWQPSAASSFLAWKGKEEAAEIAPGRSLVRGCYPGVLGKSPSDFPLPNQGCFVTETRFSPVFKKGPFPFKGDTLEPQSLGRDDSPTRQLQLVSEILKYSLGDNALNPPLFQSLLFFLSSFKKYKL